MEFLQLIAKYGQQPLSRQLLLDLLKDYKRPYDKIHELVRQGKLMAIKDGIYIPGANVDIDKPHPFLLANHLLGPSYVSVDTALSHWSLIPERVFETTSVTIQKSKTFQTPVGRFSYIHLPLPYYAFGIRQVKLTDKQSALIASPEKALCDKIITTSGILLRSIKQVKELLIDDLRIDKESLRKLNIGDISKWVNDAPKSNSLSILIKTLDTL